MIYALVCLPQNIQKSGEYPNWDSTKAFIMFLLCAKVINAHVLMSPVSFLPAFMHCDKKYSSTFKSLSIRTPKSFCYLLSQIFASPTFAYNVSYLCPEYRK